MGSVIIALCCWLCAQEVSADLYVYKDANGIVTFTNVPTHPGYRRVVRDNEEGQTAPQLVHNTKTGEIGYWDGKKIIPLWPVQYTNLEKNAPLMNSDEYEDMWVEGLSEQTGPIKMRKGVPVDVAAAAVDWLIKQNPDKYKPRTVAQPEKHQTLNDSLMNSYRLDLFIVVLVVLVASLLTFYFKDRKREQEPEQPFDPHQVLGVTSEANEEEIKAAYLNLIKKYHPDKVSHLGDEFQKMAEEKSEAINRAYQILTSR